jgi:MoxR-like ATPase
MAERQVSIGRLTYPLPNLFMVMATQNPIEQEGTYPLPEAQLDRFLMFIKVSYPSANTEMQILQLARRSVQVTPSIQKIISQETIFSARQEIMSMHFSNALEEYLVQLIIATRQPKPYGAELTKWVRFGASPRATIYLDRCARAHAWLHDRDYVAPEDIHAVAHDVLRHRVLLTYEAEAEGISPDRFITELLNKIAIP